MGSSGKFAKRGLFIFCNSHEDSLTLMMFIYTEWSSPIWFYFLWTDWSSRQINNNSRVHSEGFDIESNWKDIIDIKFLYISHSAGYKFNCSSDIFQLYWKHFWQKDEILKLCRLNCWDIRSLFFYFSLPVRLPFIPPGNVVFTAGNLTSTSFCHDQWLMMVPVERIEIYTKIVGVQQLKNDYPR